MFASPRSGVSPLSGQRRAQLSGMATQLIFPFATRARLLRVREVAEQLGVCNATVYRLVESGELSHVRIANSIRIRPDDLTVFLEREASERSSTDR